MAHKSKFNKLASLFNFIWHPDKKAKDILHRVEDQRVIIRGLADKVSDLEKWVIKYNRTLNNFTDAMGAMVWQKGADHRYLIANKLHCVNFFNLGVTSDCLNSIVGKTDAELIESIYTTAGVPNTFGQVCTVTDNFAEAKGEPCHFFEAGIVGGQQVLLYVVKIPEFDQEGKFLGTTGTGWDVTHHSLWVVHQLNRWIYSNKVEKLFRKDDVFAYHIRPVVKSCDIFKSVCVSSLHSDSPACNLCSATDFRCKHNKQLGEKLKHA